MKIKLYSFFAFSRNFSLLAIALLFTNPIFGQDYGWLRHYGTAADERALIISVSPDGDNYCSATLSDALAVAGQTLTSDGVLMKHNGGGAAVWALPYDNLSIVAIEATDTKVFVAGNFNTAASLGMFDFVPPSGNSDGFVARLSPAGVIEHVALISGAGSNEVADMDIDGTFNVYVAGSFSGTTTFGDTLIDHPGHTAHLVKFGPSGSTEWVRTSNSPGYVKLTTDMSASRIIVASRFNEEDFEDTIRFSGSTMIFTSGDDNPYGEFFLISYENSGELKNLSDFHSAFRRQITGLESTAQGEFYALVETQYGLEDLHKFDNMLNQLWYKNVPGSEIIWSNLATDEAGNIFIGGSAISGTIYPGARLNKEDWYFNSALVAKFSTSGDFLWITGLPVKDKQHFSVVRSMAIDDHTDVYICGYFNNTVVVPGSGELDSKGEHDLFVARVKGHSDYESGLAESLKSRFLLFPTVNNGSFKIITGSTAASLTVRDVSGQVCHKQMLQSNRTDHMVSCELPDGLYIAECKMTDGSYTSMKMIVRR